ncbi:MAG TPA: dolichyl-phosphate beta-glucosyltransferase [Acidimicrobiales bacterium]|nr:dolichyl-phosphate beta-glucosyltransferase [Acidimicrobiales bacterium]
MTDTAPLQLTIVVPAYNEAHRLGAGMRRFEAAVSAGAVDLERTEVVVVDDGSTDRTAQTADKLLAALPHHRVIRLPRNQGKGAAVRTGVASSRAPYTAYMDADMAIDPLAVPLLLDGLDRHDLAIGSRALPDSMVETTYVLRSLMGRFFNELVTTGTGLGLKDTQCGFKAIRTPAARLLFHLVRIDRFAFDVEILARARRLGLAVTEVPVHWKHVEGSTIHPLHDSLTMVADVLRSRRGLLGGPPVPTISVRASHPGGGTRNGTDGDLARRVSALLEPVLDGAPVPVLTTATGVTVLLALVDPADVATAHAALADGLAPLEVTRRALALGGLAALGPLAGRLDPPPAAPSGH